jgi:hypothetical protein
MRYGPAMRIAIAVLLVASLAAGCSKKNQPAPAAPKAEPSATEKAADSPAPAESKASEDPCAGGEKQPDK